MKMLLIFAATLVVSVMAIGQKWIEVHDNCFKDSGVSDEHYEKLKEGDVASQRAKTFLKCIFNAVGVMKDDSFSKEGTAMFINATIPTENAYWKIATKVLDDCSPELTAAAGTGEDVALRIFDCVKREAKNIPLGDAIPEPDDKQR